MATEKIRHRKSDEGSRLGERQWANKGGDGLQQFGKNSQRGVPAARKKRKKYRHDLGKRGNMVPLPGMNEVPGGRPFPLKGQSMEGGTEWPMLVVTSQRVGHEWQRIEGDGTKKKRERQTPDIPSQ